MTKQEALNILEEKATHLHNVDYDEIVYLMRKGIGRIPIPVAKLKKGTPIDRVRPNNGETLFTQPDELSYIKKQQIIDEKLNEFGRGNCPNQPMFYGAMESSELPYQRLTAIAETSTLYQNRLGVNVEGELLTVSRWRPSEELQVAEMVFSMDAIKANKDIERELHNQVKLMMAQTGEDLRDVPNITIIIIV